MTAGQLLCELRRAGVSLGLRGGVLVVDAPAGVLTEAVRSAVTAAKPELIGLLAGEGNAGRWFVGFAKTVGERVLFNEDGMVPPNSEGLVTYSRSELEYIKPLADDVKQRIHRAKKAFGGTVPAPPLGKEG